MQERYRARALLALLAERDLSLKHVLPDDLLAEQVELETAFYNAQRVHNDLRLDLVSPEILQTARNDVRMAKIKRDSHTDRVRALAENFANLEFPTPLSLQDAQSQIDEGTVALSYIVMDSQLLIFIVSRDEYEVRTIDVSADELRSHVKKLTYLIDEGRHASVVSAALRREARKLYALLIPRNKIIESAERLLLIPDAALHGLPFAVLIDDYVTAGSDVHRDRYLIERFALHRSLSMSLYAELPWSPEPQRRDVDPGRLC